MRMFLKETLSCLGNFRTLLSMQLHVLRDIAVRNASFYSFWMILVTEAVAFRHHQLVSSATSKKAHLFAVHVKYQAHYIEFNIGHLESILRTPGQSISKSQKRGEKEKVCIFFDQKREEKKRNAHMSIERSRIPNIGRIKSDFPIVGLLICFSRQMCPCSILLLYM